MNIRVACAVSAAALLSSAAAMAQDDTIEQEETPISLVGCIQRESDYRRQQGAGTGGFLGFGGGLSDEYVLINALRGTGGVAGDCSTHTTGDAYELTGSEEDELEAFVGQRVAITGVMKEAEVDVRTGRPTGGRQVGADLRLFEVELESFQAVAPVPSDTLARVESDRQVLERESARSSGAQVETSRVQTDRDVDVDADRAAGVDLNRETDVDDDRALPRTASPLALTGLFGLLSLGGVAGVRAFYRRDRRQFR